MTRKVDLVIVGGGPAGLSTALHLHAAAPGRSVVVLEKQAYPREKICAGGIGARAFDLLAKIGVAVECPAVWLGAIAVKVGDQTIVTRRERVGAVVRRIEFDHALAKVAIARGIEVRDGCAVVAFEVHDDGVRVETSTGERYEARAIIGADGVGGVVRRLAGFPRGELRAQVVELDTEDLPDDQPRDTVVFDFRPRELHGYAWDFPTIVEGEPKVCRGAYVIRNLGPDDAKRRLTDYLARRGLDPTRYRFKQFAERGFDPDAEISAPRVLLVGEAAGIDIATGEGIGQAIEYGALAGPYLVRALDRDRLRFSDWRAVVDRRHLGWQLKIRHACYRLFYGRRRATVEKLLPQLPALIGVGVQDFAGVPLSKLAIARGVGEFVAAYARHKMRDPEPPDA